MTIAEVLDIYGREHAPTTADPARIGYAIDALLPFWGQQPVSAVKGATCRLYVKQRSVEPGTSRRELGALGAALRFCEREGYLVSAPKVTLPAKPQTKQRAMTRDEVARLLWAARHTRHLAHFILIASYTGTRKEAILGLRLDGPALDGGYFDFEQGLIYRMGAAERATHKRRTPVRMPRQLLAHAQRWHGRGDTWAVEFRGARVGDIKTAWNKAVKKADLGWNPTPHTLKHTAITWAVQGGASLVDAAGFFATSVETIERVYWHHSPRFQDGAVIAMERQSWAKHGRGE